MSEFIIYLIRALRDGLSKKTKNVVVRLITKRLLLRRHVVIHFTR